MSVNHPIVLVLGPPGSGKSTVVRQIMSLYPHRQVLGGGVGALPMGYDLQTDGGEHKLLILGNYGDIGRASYGMDQFSRWSESMRDAMHRATATKYPVLMEDGFHRVGILDRKEHAEFRARLQIVYLGVPDELCRLGVVGRRNHDEAKFNRHSESARKRARRMQDRGVPMVMLSSRALVLEKVRSLVQAPLKMSDLPLLSWR